MPERTSTGTVGWPDEFAARYVAKGYWAGLSVGAHILAAAEGHPGPRSAWSTAGCG